MVLGKNLRLASIVEYKDKSLVFEKYVILGKNNKSVINPEDICVLNCDCNLMEYIKRNNIKRFYMISNIAILKLDPYKLYSVDNIKLIEDNLNKVKTLK